MRFFVDSLIADHFNARLQVLGGNKHFCTGNMVSWRDMHYLTITYFSTRLPSQILFLEDLLGVTRVPIRCNIYPIFSICVACFIYRFTRFFGDRVNSTILTMGKTAPQWRVTAKTTKIKLTRSICWLLGWILLTRRPWNLSQRPKPCPKNNLLLYSTADKNTLAEISSSVILCLKCWNCNRWLLVVLLRAQ